jgi:hypothetical protein
MKLEKAELEKLVLGALLFSGVTYGYWAFLLSPLRLREKQVGVVELDLDRKLKEAREKVAKGERARMEGPLVQQVLDQVAGMIPEGAPVAWFPSQISTVFRENGIGKSAVRLISESPEKALEGYTRTVWAVEVPKAEFIPLARSVAALENGHPLVEVTSMGVESNRDDPERMRVVLGLRRLVKK